MSVYITLLCAPFVIHLIGLLFFPNKKNIEIFLNSVILILFVGLRHYTVGADTMRYAQHFYEIEYYISSANVWEKACAHESPLYILFTWLLTRTGMLHYLYFTIVAAMHFTAFAVLISKFSTNVAFSYFIYVSLFLPLQLTGIKNTLATTFLFIALIFALKKKLWPFLISMVIAYFFHKTTLVFIVVYPLINIKKIKINGYSFVTIFAILFVFKTQISAIAKRIGGYEDYGVHESAPIMMLILCGGIVFASLFVKNVQTSDYFDKLILIAMIATFAMTLVFVNPSALRIVRYFLIVATLLLPELFRIIELNQPNRWHVLLLMVPFYVLLGYQFIGSVNGAEQYVYRFYWQ